LVENKKNYKRPSTPVEKWAKLQAAKWIRSAVKNGCVEFSYSRHSQDRGLERGVSPDDAVECINSGNAIHWEPGFHSASQKADMRMKFEQVKRTKTISTVVAVSNENPDVIVVTLISKARN
jgi:hypothetical protein